MMCAMTVMRRYAVSRSATEHGGLRSVDLHRPALDAVCTGGAAQQIGAAQQDLAIAGENDRGLAAAEHDLLLGGEDEAFAVEARVDGAAEREVERRRRLVQEPHADRTPRIAAFEQ